MSCPFAPRFLRVDLWAPDAPSLTLDLTPTLECADVACLFVANMQTFIPLALEVASSPNRCEYIGTILIERVAGKFHVTVVDTFNRFGYRYRQFVEGCDLKRAIAVEVQEQSLASPPLNAGAPAAP